MYFSFFMCSFLCSLVVWLLLDFNIIFQVTFEDFSERVWIHSVALEAPQEFRFLTCLVFIFLGFLKLVCSCFGLREHVSYYDKFGGLSCFSIEPTSSHLCIHFTCELYQKGCICRPSNLSHPLFIYLLLFNYFMALFVNVFRLIPFYFF